VQAGQWPQAIELPARVVMDPNAGGRVQAALAGRVVAGPRGLPTLGQAVQRGQVLAHVEPTTGSLEQASLLAQQAEFKGVDEQTDTYFQVPNGRLKLREGRIENNLIQYNRPNQAGPKNSDFKLVKVPDAAGLKTALAASLGIKVIVQKKREIYFIGNVKFHIDEVPGLGSFMEIEAGNIGTGAGLGQPELLEQCRHYMQQLGIRNEDLIQVSYSDMLLAATEGAKD